LAVTHNEAMMQAKVSQYRLSSYADELAGLEKKPTFQGEKS
jgi:hypothetical protein